MRLMVLGSAQDAGLPQLGCGCIQCARAQREPEFRRLPACLAVMDDRHRQTIVFDAPPTLPEQLARLRTAAASVHPIGCDALLLTHAHMGHYPGLMYLGREAASTKQFPVHVSPKMAAFLRANRPFAHLATRGEITLLEFVTGRPFPVTPALIVTPVAVQHRNEDADTHAFVIEAGGKRLLYVPDLDVWDDAIVAVLAGCDAALIDGTFFSPDELPSGRMKVIAHPPMVDVMDRLGALAGRVKIWFTHLNHTNPAADPAGEAARRLAERGFGVAAEGQILDLG